MKKIEKFVAEKINPYLAEHGGGVEVSKYNEQTKNLYLRIYGQCCSCPHSIDTNENFIKVNIIKEFPEIKNIVIENGVSDDLWNIAKNILRKEKDNEGLERGI